MKHITIRGVPEDMARALDEARQRRGRSLNRTILDLLREGLQLDLQGQDNGLSKLAGTWSADELAEFDKSTEVFEQIDEELWQ